VSCLRENRTSSSYGEGLETGRTKPWQRTSPSPDNQIPLDSSGNAGTPVALASSTFLQPSWNGQWHAISSGAASAIALALIDDAGSMSYWGFLNGNPSHNGAAALQCCTPSLAWEFGVPTNDTTKPSKPDVVKTFPLNNISCKKPPTQIISDMETNFPSFANFNGTSNFLGTGGALKTNTFDVAVQVTQVNPNGFTFTTLPGHVLYPATISFAASSSGAGSLNFAINVNGNFANRSAEIGYYAAGNSLENHIWNHVLAQVQSDCK
jgi:hypothetical protein